MPNQSQFEELSEAEKLRLLRKKLREQFKREQREFFESFCKNPELFPDEPPAKHHQFMIGALQGVANGEIKRLMVLMPPVHGKSVYCSIRFPAWYLGNNPRNHLVHATNTAFPFVRPRPLE